jgi:hypothetical protein
METPPQFSPPNNPPKKSNTVLIVVLVVLGLCAVCCIGLIFAGMGFFNKMKGSIGCLTHYELTREAISDYAAANGGKLPPAKTWQDDIAQYYGKHNGDRSANGGGIIDLGNPSKDLGCAAEDGAGPTGISYNSDLSGKTVDEAKQNPSTVLLFEVPETGRNLNSHYKPQSGQSPLKIFGQPRDWITIPVSGAMNINPKGTTSNSRGVNGL